MVIAIFKQTVQATRFGYVVNIGNKMNKKFVGPDGQVFVVDEVLQTPAGLTVFYINDTTKEKYSCLIDAFAERFKELSQ